jgi:Fur family ferric uptake transcriptional regulator
MDLPRATATMPTAGATSGFMGPLCAIFRRFLKSRDLKYTQERADILNAIIEREDTAFEADELVLELGSKSRTVSKATIYRTIRLLQEAGIITQTLFDSKQAHYRLVYGRAPRDTITCVRSGEQIEFLDEDLMRLRDRICRRHGWEPIGHRLQIYALSPEVPR